MTSATKKSLLISGAALAPIAFVLGICILFAAAVAGGAAGHDDESGDSALAAQGVPAKVDGVDAVMLAAYGRAAQRITALRPKCQGMPWSVIAGIGKVESNHAAGRTIATSGDISPRILGPRLDGSGVGGNTTPVRDTDGGRWDGDTRYDRAVGPMQFIPSTWAGIGQDGNDDGVKDPDNAFDAALGTAVYLCGTTSSDLSDDAQLRKAILRYNHSGAYADKVMGYIRQYDQLAPAVTSGSTDVGAAAGAVIAAALKEQGTPYVWGGGDIHGPTSGGYDCSGLLVYAFYQGARITLPRTSQAMRSVGTKVSRAEMQPGDLIVFNNDGNWGHVGLYLGGGKMVNAPRPGKSVETALVSSGYWARYDWDIRRVF
ncbi:MULTISPECIES: C40 family peptidase [unclassified Streptomyces]|uniref:C40 family peptidase n=1 Tax=unclassified Streptomyces TaxID=2593676 RepID=UPI002E18C6E5|nr:MULTISPECIES: bifunctional lytic transglycosylase/C40 family peptidase [unclassified Streptomyces]